MLYMNKFENYETYSRFLKTFQERKCNFLQYYRKDTKHVVMVGNVGLKGGFDSAQVPVRDQE